MYTRKMTSSCSNYKGISHLTSNMAQTEIRYVHRIWALIVYHTNAYSQIPSHFENRYQNLNTLIIMGNKRFTAICTRQVREYSGKVNRHIEVLVYESFRKEVKQNMASSLLLAMMVVGGTVLNLLCPMLTAFLNRMG